MIPRFSLHFIVGAAILSIMSFLLIRETDGHMEPLVDDLPKIENLTCTCERVYVPVCSTDNRTYINECYFNCVNKYKEGNDTMTIMWWGPCVSTRFDKIIDLEYIAVYDIHKFPWS